MIKTTVASSKGRKRTSALNASTVKGVAVVYPMMPREYTAIQRAQLRMFEKELLKGRKVSVD